MSWGLTGTCGRKATGGQSAGWVTVWKHLGWLYKGDGRSFSSFEGQVGNHCVNRVRIIFKACINVKTKIVIKSKRQVGTREWRCLNARPRSLDFIPLAKGKYSRTKEWYDNQSTHSELMLPEDLLHFCVSRPNSNTFPLLCIAGISHNKASSPAIFGSR